MAQNITETTPASLPDDADARRLANVVYGPDAVIELDTDLQVPGSVFGGSQDSGLSDLSTAELQEAISRSVFGRPEPEDPGIPQLKKTRRRPTRTSQPRGMAQPRSTAQSRGIAQPTGIAQTTRTVDPARRIQPAKTVQPAAVREAAVASGTSTADTLAPNTVVRAQDADLALEILQPEVATPQSGVGDERVDQRRTVLLVLIGIFVFGLIGAVASTIYAQLNQPVEPQVPGVVTSVVTSVVVEQTTPTEVIVPPTSPASPTTATSQPTTATALTVPDIGGSRPSWAPDVQDS